MSDARLWFPYWQKPMSPDDWDRLASQALLMVEFTQGTLRGARLNGMPDWFISKRVRSVYRRRRRAARVCRRAEEEKTRLLSNLLHAMSQRGKR
jgi:hypothetical protein